MPRKMIPYHPNVPEYLREKGWTPHHGVYHLHLWRDPSHGSSYHMDKAYRIQWRRDCINSQ